MTQRSYRYKDLTFVSENRYKHAEYESLLGISGLTFSEQHVSESQDVNVTALALQKLRGLAREMAGRPYFVEHSGLVIDAWRNLPGGLTRVFLDNVGNDGICRMMADYRGQDRAATAIAVIGFRWPDGSERTFEGRKRGRIADEPVGSLNFGWDPIFIPDGQAGDARTYAEMNQEEKNRLSMRRGAAEMFLDEISSAFKI